MKTPVNAGTLRHHFMYSWWKYLLAILAGTLLVNLIFTVTEPRTPENKKVDFYIYGYADTFTLDEYMEKVRLNEMPDMESMTSLNILTDSTYGPMQLITYLAAGEGDAGGDRGMVGGGALYRRSPAFEAQHVRNPGRGSSVGG